MVLREALTNVVAHRECGESLEGRMVLVDVCTYRIEATNRGSDTPHRFVRISCCFAEAVTALTRFDNQCLFELCSWIISPRT